MKGWLHVLVDCIAPAIALVSGLVSLKRMDRFHVLVFAQLAAWCVFLAVSYAVTFMQQERGVTLNNHAVFNVHLPVETLLLLAAAAQMLVSPRQRKLIMAASLLFVAVLTFQIVRAGVDQYANYADVTASFALALVYGLAMFTLFQRSSAWWREPAIVICAGIFVYYACSIPYLAAFGYLQENFPDVSRALLHLVNDTLAGIRYLALAVGFWLLRL